MTSISRFRDEIEKNKLVKVKQDRYVVMRNNVPAAVMLPVAAYEAILDELEDLRIEAISIERIQTFNPSKAISHEEMMKHFTDGDAE